MRKTILATLGICLVGVNLYAQTYSGGLPIPGLPVSRGPKTMSGSTSVTIATDQTPIGVTGTFTSTALNVTTNYTSAPTSSALIGYIDQSGLMHPFLGDANGITVNAIQATSPWVTSRNWVLSGLTDSVGVTGTVSASILQPLDIRDITGTVSLPTGAATEATLAASGVTLTSIDSKLPTTLGQKTAAQSLAVVLASDQVPLAVTGTFSTTAITVTSSTINRVANSASNQTLLSANGDRKQVFLFNDSSNTDCYVKFGATASTTSFSVKLFATDTYIMDPPVYTGQIDYICDAASGSMEVTEQ